MATIKLYYVNTLDNGTKRFQSQLYVGKASADFVMREDGVMLNWGHGNKGWDFYEFKDPYEIVSDVKEMSSQKL